MGIGEQFGLPDKTAAELQQAAQETWQAGDWHFAADCQTSLCNSLGTKPNLITCFSYGLVLYIFSLLVHA